MGQIADIVINDGESTPVAHTFKLGELKPGFWKFEDRSGGIEVGYPLVCFWISPTSKTSRLRKVRLKIMIPKLEVVNASTYNGITPAPTKAYDVGFDGTFFMPDRATTQEIKNVRMILANFLGSGAGVAFSILDNREMLY